MTITATTIASDHYLIHVNMIMTMK